MPRLSLRRLPLLVGFLLGVSASLLFVDPLRCELDSDAAIEPVINLQSRDSAKTKRHSPVIRPRFYSTELQIKEKLLVISLTDVQNLKTLGAALNHTLAAHVSKLIFYVCTDRENPSPDEEQKETKSNVVMINSKCNNSLYYALEHLKSHRIVDDYDFTLLARDSTFFRGDNLMSLVNHISVIHNVYMGVPLSTDPQLCDLESGIIFSNSVMNKILNNLNSCFDRSEWSADDDPMSCLTKFAEMPCQSAIGNIQFESLDAESRIPIHSLVNSQRSVISVAPLNFNANFYRLNYAFDKETMLKVRGQLVGIGKSLSEIASKCKLKDTWPTGLRKMFKPKRHFDVIRTTLFNETHSFWSSDNKVSEPFNEITAKEIDDVKKQCERFVRAELKLVNGWSTVDPMVGVEYYLDVVLNGTIRRLHVVRPLSLTELTPMPYVTEDARITIVMFVHEEQTELVMDFLDKYTELMEKGDQSMLLLVFVAKKPTSKEFDRIRKTAESLSKQFARKRSKIALLTIQCPAYTPEFGLTDIVATKLPPKDIMLVLQPNSILSSNFLNRVRLNTIKNEQVFMPIPFMQFKSSEHPEKLPMTKDTGYFDNESLENYSIYVSDYLNIRKTLANVPLAMVSADLNRDIYKNSKYGIPEILMASKQLHIMRAIEPELHIEYVNKNCHALSSNSRQQSFCERNRRIALGSKKQLAMILAS